MYVLWADHIIVSIDNKDDVHVQEEVIGYLFTSNQLAAQAWLPKKPVEILNVEGDAVETATEEPFLTVGPGIRKIRLGTFEDTGKCKG